MRNAGDVDPRIGSRGDLQRDFTTILTRLRRSGIPPAPPVRPGPIPVVPGPAVHPRRAVNTVGVELDVHSQAAP
jgi:hypothetical protein